MKAVREKEYGVFGKCKKKKKSHIPGPRVVRERKKRTRNANECEILQCLWDTQMREGSS